MKKRQSETSCPICLELWFRIDLCFETCEEHLDWYVTLCKICNKVCFSDCVGFCLECVPMEDER